MFCLGSRLDLKLKGAGEKFELLRLQVEMEKSQGSVFAHKIGLAASILELNSLTPTTWNSGKFLLLNKDKVGKEQSILYGTALTKSSVITFMKGVLKCRV